MIIESTEGSVRDPSQPQAWEQTLSELEAILAGAQAPKNTAFPSPRITIDNVFRYYNPDSVF